MERSVLQGLAAFRWAAWCWMAFVFAVGGDRLASPGLGVALIAAALVATVALSLAWRRDPSLLLRRPVVLGELALGTLLVAGDGLVRARGEAFTTGQSVGSVWPLVGVLTAGVAAGPAAGATAGAVVGLARVVSTLLNHVGGYDTGRVLSLTSTVFFYAMAGAVAGYAYRLIARAREEVAAARAREDVARTLHDGVLQTLALVERRATDPALARLAREQERDLRAYLFGDRQAPPTDLGAALRAAAGRFEDAHGGRAQVVVADDLPPLRPAHVEALAGAVGEALANAGKHAGDRAVTVVVYVEEDDSGAIFCSVKDDGPGFEPATTPAGIGITRSIRGRIEELGGRVEIAGDTGTGTEVRLWLPRT
jgi:signal transduction histidine kinase